MSQDFPRPAPVFWIETLDQVELLSDVTRLEIIENLERPSTAAEVAERMRVPRTRLYHHLNALADAGLILVVGSRQSGARTEKVYQVTALSFRPSPELLADALPRERALAVIRTILATTEADFIRSVEAGSDRLEDDRSRRRTHLGRRLALLGEDQLHSLISELEEVLARYEGDADAPTGPDREQKTPVAILTMVYPSSRIAP